MPETTTKWVLISPYYADPGTAKFIKDPKFFQRRKQLLLNGEHLVFSTLNFDLNIETPYKPLASALKKLNAK
jgi:cyclin T